MRKYAEWWRERGSWVLCEEIRAQLIELDALLDADERGARRPSESEAELLAGARRELDEARRIVDFAHHRRAVSSSHVTTARLHLDTARSLWLRTLPSTALEAHIPGMLAVVSAHLPDADARRAAMERVALELRAAREAGKTRDLESSERAAIISAVDAARQAELRERVRAGSFVVIVRWVAVFLFVLAAAVAVLSAIFQTTVPLCFEPADTQASGRQMYSVVCPVRESERALPEERLGAETERVVSREDYIVVEFAGLVAAGIAAASALRKIRGTSTAFGIPVALAVLKLPTGALTAVLGLLLMRGGFIPGLTALDSSAQIIAWAIIFGYSQELFTKFVDRRGQDVLEGVQGAGGPAPLPQAAGEGGR